MLIILLWVRSRAMGVYLRKLDFAEAIKWFTKAANQGDKNAQFNLGVCYSEGKGCVPDLQKAAYWYKKSGKAQAELSRLYEREAYNKDVQEYYRQVQRDAYLGDEKAQIIMAQAYAMGIAREQDPAKAIEWYMKAAEQGNETAINNLGAVYLSGNIVPKDLKKAIFWFEKGAQMDNPKFDYLLAVCYEEDGQYEKAVEHYSKAAAKEHVEALRCLGDCYYLGRGVEKNLELAARCYYEAVQHDDDYACFLLANCFLEGHGMPQDYEAALMLLKRAADRGIVPAQYRLARCYQEGTGTKRDLQSTIHYYTMAAEGGDLKAQEALREINEELERVMRENGDL